jgi:membrane peptidoglycan carboxypeptidase
VLTGTAAAVLLVGVAWPLTPSVGDAESRIAARLAAHGAHDPGALPVPDRVGEAIIATEDSRFRSHHGLDLLGVVRAALSVSNGDAGGATLDQQLAKNLWTGDGGWLLKAEQVELSFKLEASYSKNQILEMYLSAVYFGHGYYGLPAAARGYFGVAPSDLSWAQASLLAGLVQAPSAYDPYRHPTLAKSRQGHVLDRLVATHRLTRPQADQVLTTAWQLR